MKTSISVSVNLNNSAMQILKNFPDKVIKQIARQTLDQSYQTIPRDRGNLRTSSKAYGVKGGNGDYTIGSTTSYAKYVWNMNPNSNWTTPGTTSQWYINYFKKKGKSIVANAVNTNLLK